MRISVSRQVVLAILAAFTLSMVIVLIPRSAHAASSTCKTTTKSVVVGKTRVGHVTYRVCKNARGKLTENSVNILMYRSHGYYGTATIDALRGNHAVTNFVNGKVKKIAMSLHAAPLVHVRLDLSKSCKTRNVWERDMYVSL